MKLRFLFYCTCLFLFGSCVALKNAPKNSSKEFEIDYLEEKPTRGDEKIVGIGLYPPFFANVGEINRNLGVSGTYSSFDYGNAYANLTYYPPNFGALDKNVKPVSFSPVCYQLRYSFPLIKYTRHRKMFVPFEETQSVIYGYDTEGYFNKSVNLRLGLNNQLRQFDGSDITLGYSEVANMTFIQKTTSLTAGLSYVIFLDHQSKLFALNKEHKVSTSILVEMYIDGYFSLQSKFDQMEQNINEFYQPATTPSDDFRFSKTGIQLGVRYSYFTQKSFRAVYAGYSVFPGYQYTGIENPENPNSYLGGLLFGFEIGFPKRIKTQGTLF